MGFTTQDTLDEYWRRMKNAAKAVKERSTVMSNQAAVGCSIFTILDYSTFLEDQLLVLNSCVVPGIVAYGQAQLNNPARDVTAEFNTMTTAIQSTINWIIANTPKDGGNFLLVLSFVPGSSRTTPRLFSAGELVNFKAFVDGLLGTLS